jgi:uncharacterized protein (DUF2252 family)
MPQLHTNPEDRKGVLDHSRRLKMAESAHAYVRGNTVRFYDWLATDAVRGTLPNGPDIWICGDCHTGNLGPVANVDGKIEIEIRDLDQTVIGNPAHDLLRLGLSLAMASRSSDLPGVTTALMIEEMIGGYLARLQSHSTGVRADEIEPIGKVMREASRRQWRHLAEERIEDVRPHIPLGRRFWTLTEEERTDLQRVFKEDGLRELILKMHGKQHTQVELLDAAYWMKGCSSLGRLRYAALVGVGGKKHRRFHLLDIKEATAAAAPRSATAEMPVNDAERVVCGARALSPHLGGRMLATRLSHHHDVVVRELRPQDMKFEFAGLSKADAIATARLLAGVVGRAHGRQMPAEDRKRWAKELQGRHSKGLDAPRWLWSSILDLAALHEAAYLEHCRQYALGETRAAA